MELFTRIFIILSLAAIVIGAGKDLPKSFAKCKKSDPNFTKCLVTAVTDAIQDIKTGLPEFGILSLDPLVINSLSISQGGNSPVNLRQEFKNVKMSYLSDSVIKRYVSDLDNYRLKATAVTPRMEMIGDYIMDGRVLVLPIVGKGKANVTLIELATKHELIGEPYKKDGEVYWRLTEYKIKFEPKRAYFHFENLFNGDKTLGDTMNNFLNENWQIVFNEIKGGYEDTLGLIFKEISNKIFLKVPMNKIFLE